jgi:hypothetical protein
VPVLRLGLDLGDARAACVRLGEGPWQTVVVPADQTFAFGSLQAGPAPARTLTLASPLSGRAVEVECVSGTLEAVMLLCDVAKQVLVAVVAPAPDAEAGREPVTAAFRVYPLAHVEDLPSISLPEAHSPERLVIEDGMLSIGHYGEWGEQVADPDAEDGSAAKLFGTHYEWCVQWFVDPTWLAPGARYAVRMRLRVEKSGTPGKAFWAGVYDAQRRRGLGQTETTVDQLGDGYQWYEVATWTPEAGQYVWAGPGPFDQKGGATSAVKAVYLDRLELVRVP